MVRLPVQFCWTFVSRRNIRKGIYQKVKIYRDVYKRQLRMILILVNTLFITIIKHSKQVLFSLMQTVLWIMSRSEKKFISV